MRIKVWFLKLALARILRRPDGLVVVGSAPAAVMPQEKSSLACVCVNGSPAIAAARGLAIDLTVINGWTIRHSKRTDKKSIHKLAGLSGIFSSKVVILETGASRRRAAKILERFSFGYGQIISINRDLRNQIVKHVAGKPPDVSDGYEQISTGAFAVALSLFLGAKKLVIAGFSLSNGHSSISIEAEETTQNVELISRYHVEIDRWFFSTLATRYPKVVSTTSRELSALTGIRFTL